MLVHSELCQFYKGQYSIFPVQMIYTISTFYMCVCGSFVKDMNSAKLCCMTTVYITLQNLQFLLI